MKGNLPLPRLRLGLCRSLHSWLFFAVAALLPEAHAKDVVTFNRDVAPILFQNCSTCHRPGLSAPFSLLNYSDARKHSTEIVDVTQRRYMPPWLPDADCGHFVGERVLSSESILTFRKWVEGGMEEGRPEDLPALPKWAEGWQLGPPDLVVTMPQPYVLAPEGKDVYRNFVIPIPLQKRHFIRGVEFHPGNQRVVHHGFIQFDSTRKSRGMAEGETPPSFPGMDLPETAVMPGGQMLGWQPGKVPYFSPDGLSWVLNPGSDLVLQLHLHPSGKPEPVQASVGFYFTDRPPTNSAFRMELVRFDLDIPPNPTNYVVEHAYSLPIDVQLIGISPHTHYLGRDLSGYAILPTGERKCLIHVPDWDFNWQGDYRFVDPVFLPKGTSLHMRYQFDNSTGNPRNPFHPPQQVKYGLQTTDEMAELWFQLLPIRPADGPILGRDYTQFRRLFMVEYYEGRLRTNARDGLAHLKLASAYQFLGRAEEAFDHFSTAARLLPDDARAHYELGYQYLMRNRFAEATPELEIAVRLDPKDHQAFGCLGISQMGERKLDQAEMNLEKALQLNPDDTLARQYLNQLKAGR